MAELRTLGLLELTLDSRIAEDAVLSQPRRSALLCYLALARPRGFHSRDIILSMFWPEQADEQARQALRQSVYILRKSLGNEVILSRGDGTLALAPEKLGCDVREFDRALHDGRLEDALLLYRGDLLPGFFISDAPDFEKWLASERTWCRQRAATAAWSLAEAKERSGDSDSAATWGRRAAELLPADESVIRKLMLLLDRQGDTAGALREYDSLAATLRDEYDLEPSSETNSVVGQLREKRREPGTGRALQKGRALGTADPAQVTSEAAKADRSESDSHQAEAQVSQQTSSHVATTSTATPATSKRAMIVLLVAAVVIVVAVLPGTGLWPGSGKGDTDSPRKSLEPTAEYLRAEELFRQAADPKLVRTDSGARHRMRLLQEAVRADPAHARARAYLASTYLRVYSGVMARNTDMTFADALQLARIEAEMSIKLDSLLAEGHNALGKVWLSSYRLPDSEQSFKRALALDTGLVIVREHLVWLYVFMGRREAALEQAQTALNADPLSPGATVELARALLVNDRCAEALVTLAVLDKLNPPLLRAAPIAAQCHAQQRNYSAAVQTMRNSEGRGPFGDALLVYFLAQNGQREEAIAIRDRLVAEALRDGGSSFPAALAYAGLGDATNAFSWLDRAVGDYSLFFPIAEPMFRELRADPRFERIARRLGMERW